MATRYDDLDRIIARGRRRASGLPPEDEAPDPLDDIIARGREREATRQAEQQAAQVSRARTITRPNTTAPADATARGLDPASPGGESGFRGAGGGYDNWDDGTGFMRNLGRYAADAAGPGFVQHAGSTLRTIGDVLPQTQSFVGARELLERGGSAIEDYGLAHRAQAPRVQSLSDALESGANLRDYMGSTLGQGFGSSAASVAGAFMGGIPGAVAGAYTQQVGEVRGEFDQIAPDLDPRTRALGSLGLAAPLAALDILPEAMLAKRAKSALTGQAADYLTDRTLRETLGAVGRETLKGAASEGITEGLQEGGQYFGTRAIAQKPMDLWEGLGRMGEATVAGALPGSVMGGTTAGIEDGMGRFRRRGIGEGTAEPMPAPAGAGLPAGAVEPLDPAAGAPAAPAAPPRPGNVPEAPAARGKKKQPKTTAPTPPPDLATALEAQANMADEQAATLAPPVAETGFGKPAPMGPPVEDFQPDVEPTPDELAAVLGAAGEPMVEPPFAEQVPESDRSPVPEPAPPVPDVFSIERYVGREEAAEAAYRRGEPTDQFHEERSADYEARQALLAAMPDAELKALGDAMTARIEPMERGPARDSAIGLVDFVHGEMDKRGMPTPDDRFWYPKPAPTPAAKPKKAKKGVQPAPSLSEGLAQAADPTPAPAPVAEPKASTPQVRHEVGSTVRDSNGKAWVVKRVNDDGSMSLMPEQYSGVPIGQSVRAEDTGTFTADTPSAPSRPQQKGDAYQNPSGKWAIVGADSYVQADGSPLTQKLIDGINHVGPGLFLRSGEIKNASYDTREEAEAAWAARSGTSPAGAAAPAAGSVQDDRTETAGSGPNGGTRVAGASQGAVPRPNAGTRSSGAGTAPVVAGQAEPGARPDDGNGAPQADDESVAAPEEIEERFARSNRIDELRAKKNEAPLSVEEEAELQQLKRDDAAMYKELTGEDRKKTAEDTAEELLDNKRGLEARKAKRAQEATTESTNADVRSDAAVSGTPDTGGVRTGVGGQPVPQRPADVRPEGDGRDAAGRSDGRGEGSPAVDGNDPQSDDGAVPASGLDADGMDDATGTDREGDRDGGGASAPSGQPPLRLVAAGDRPAGTNWHYDSWQSLVAGKPKEKALNNIAAIKLSLSIEAEERTATRDEQAILAKFVGWGPLSKWLKDRHKLSYAEAQLQDEIREALGEEDYQAARVASLNSHYTDPRVVQEMYALLERLGVRGGRFLEPSVGSGLFLGMQPRTMAANTRWLAGDLDPTTARIARLLYPEAAVHTIGFQKLVVADNSIDVAISNVPFGNYPIADRSMPKEVRQQIHDYFFARTLQKVRPGGLVVFITSAGTMDKGSTVVREYLQKNGASLVTSIRLPAGAFQDIAATQVTTDLIVLQKAPDREGPAWTKAVQVEQDGHTFTVNEYYREHPEQMLGELSMAGSMYRANSQELKPREGEDLVEALRTAVARVPEGLYTPAAAVPASPKAPVKVEGVTATVRVGSYQLGKGGQILVRRPDGMEVADVPASERDRTLQYMKIRDAYKAAMQAQFEGAPEKTVKDTIATLNKEYDAFVKKFGPVNLEKHSASTRLKKDGTPVAPSITFPNRQTFDAEWPLVAGLENYDHDAYVAKLPDAVTKSPALVGRVIPVRVEAESASTPNDALGLTLSALGRIDEPRVAELLGIKEAAVEQTLGELVFRDPQSGRLEPKGLYLAGDVKEKLALAQDAVRQDPKYRRNVEALEAVQPEDIPAAYIPTRIGQTWIPVPVYEQFVQEVLRVRPKLSYVPMVGKVLGKLPFSNTVAGKQLYGTEDMNAAEIFETLLEGKPIVVKDPPAAKGEKPKKNDDKTALAIAKAEALAEKFTDWLWESPTRSATLMRAFNDTFNRVIEPEWDGSHLTTPGVAETLGGGRPFEWLSHQKNGIWRYITEGNTALVYDVGAGKTFTMVGIAMEARRLGLARRPVITYPNNLLAQFPREAQALYPNANILAANEKDLASPKGREAFVARMQSGDFDMILMPESLFVRIGMSEEAVKAFYNEQVEEWLAVRAAMDKDSVDERDPGYKAVLAAIAALTVRLEERVDVDSKDQLLTWEELAPDLLIVDEAHRYKNLYFPTTREGVSGTQNKRSTDFYLKTRYMHRANPGRGLVLASGTIVANNIAPELYAMQRYLQPDALTTAGLHHFDAWLAQFTTEKQELEQKANGEFAYVSKIDEWSGVDDLQPMFFQVMDVQKAATDPEDGKPAPRGQIYLKRPPRLNDRATIIEVPGSSEMDDVMKWVATEYDRVIKLRPDERAGEPIVPVLVKIAEASAIDMRLAWASAPDSATSKLSVAAKEIAQRWRDSKAIGGVQIVFLDVQNSMEKRGKPGFVSHEELMRKLHEDYGIPRAEMESIVTARSPAKAVADANAGRIRVLIGTTERMGVGINLQKRTTAIHHLDVPWRPDQLEQRNGRAIRQGHWLWSQGKIEGVEEVRYATVGSMDAFKWGKVERKGASISGVMTRRPKGSRGSIEDVDISGGGAEEIAQIKAIASGNPYLLEVAGIKKQMKRLEGLRKAEADNARRATQDLVSAKARLKELDSNLVDAKVDLEEWTDLSADKFAVKLDGTTYTKRPEAYEAWTKLFEKIKDAAQGGRDVHVGTIGRFSVALSYERGKGWFWQLEGATRYVSSAFDKDVTVNGQVTRLENVYSRIPEIVRNAAATQERVAEQVRDLSSFQYGGFSQQAELDRLKARKLEIDQALIAMNKKPEPTAAEEAEEDEEDGTEERAAYTDPIAALIGESIKQIKKLVADRSKATEPLFRSNFEEVEARLQVGEKGLPTLPWMDKARLALANLKASFSRHFPALETTKDGVHVVAHELLLGAERSGNWAKAMAADQLVTIVQGLSKGDVQTMARKLALDDIMKDIDAGLYDEGTVPFYGLDADGKRLPLAEVRDRVATDLATANAAIQSAPTVAAATTRRAEMAQALTTRLVEIDALPEKVLDDPRYFHRQVLSYAQARLTEQMAHPAGVGAPREVRNRTRSFQRRRVGGGEFNLAYQESEYEWIANAYQVIALHDILAAMKQAADITPALKAQATAVNLQAFYDRALPDGMTRADLALNPQADPLRGFRMKIGRGTSSITQAIAKGELSVPPHFQRMVADWLDAEARGERFAHPQYWAFLAWLVSADQGDASIGAATIFKAIRERNELIKTTLGRDFIDTKNPDDLLELAPEGYRTWQPEKGMLFYSALTIAEKAVIEGTQNTLEGEAFRRAMVMGGMKPTWIIPTGIAMTMDSLTPAKGPANALDAVVTGEVRLWKQWTLLSPLRAIKYNFNNAAGDADATLLAPGVMRHVGASARDLWHYMRERKTEGAVAREIQEAIRLGVVDQGQAAAEIPDVVTLPGLEALANASPSAFTAAIAFYWKHARGLTTYRENILRFAAYRYFQSELRAGRRRYAASNRARVDGLRGINEKAALLARDLVGDYGNITVAGETVRDRLIPFYSWLEINAKRYVNYFRNLPFEEEGVGAAAGRGAAAIATRIGLKTLGTGINLSARFAVGAGAAAAFLTLVALINATVHPEEWEEMRRTGREGHLILGHYDDGSIKSIRVEGAFADFLGWVGMKDIAGDIRDVANGKMGYGDLAKEAALAPVGKIINGLEPTMKSLYQFFTGKSLFPDPLNPRIARDPLGRNYGVFFDQWSIGWAYRQVVAPLAGAPKVPSRPGNPLLGLLLYQTDAGELAYQNVRSQAIAWREKQGKEQTAGDPTARSNALYWFKKASQWGEDEAATAWLQRYYQLGGTAKDVGQAMKRAHPLGVLAQKDQRAFQLSRSPAELEQLDRATDWYRRVMLSEGANAVRGTPRPAPATTGPSWIDRYRTQLQKPTTR